ncbi:MAG: hypothetical protein JWO31_1367, partial [Phycisphaerales bacterium]|nr:hypothetical protein [Phycisphaerales bacterium]
MANYDQSGCIDAYYLVSFVLMVLPTRRQTEILDLAQELVQTRG